MKDLPLGLKHLAIAALFALFPMSRVVAQDSEAPLTLTQPSRSDSPYDLRGLSIDPDAKEPSYTPDTSRAAQMVRPFPTPPAEPRMVAEWEPVQAALIRYPLGISVDAVKLIASELKTYVLCTSLYQSSATAAFQNAGVNLSNIVFISAPTDTYWTRDYGPLWITHKENGKRVVRMLDLVCRPNGIRPNDDQVPSILATTFNMPTYFSLNFICQGSNAMTDSLHGGASTDYVQDENPNLSYSQIKQGCSTYLGINPYYMMMGPVYPGEHNNHLDSWAKFIAPNKVLVKRVPSSDLHYSRFEEAANTWANQTDAAGHPYQVIRIDGSYDSPYVNHVILNDRVLVPILTSETDPADKTALDQIKAAYGSSYRVIGVKAAPGLPWLASDALHCRVSSIPVFSGLFDQNADLTLTSLPPSQSVTVGATASFQVTVAGGTAPYTYQWYKNHAAVSGATNASYSFTAQAADNNASLYVVVTDSSSPMKIAASNIATLMVSPAAPPLTITTQPVSQTVSAGSSVTFTVAAAGGIPSYTYQWFKNNVAVSGATGASYTFTALLADNNASMHVVVSDSSSPVKTIASSIATLTVNPAGNPLIIKNQPDSVTVNAGSTVEFKVKAKGGIEPYTYQWFKNNVAVSGATKKKYTFTAQAADNNASIYVVVSDSSNPVKTINSSIAILTVNLPLSITTQPASQTVTMGSPVTFTVAAAGGITPYTYQWYKNNVVVSGATGTSYTFNAQLSDNNSTIYVVVSDSSSPVKTLTSIIATLTVNPAVDSLIIKNQPDSMTVNAGSPVEFKVKAEGGTKPYTFQWFKNNAAVSGATEKKFTFTAQAQDNHASIYVVVSDSSSPVKTIASSIAILTVNPAAPPLSITTQPASKTIAVGSSVAFTVAAAGGIPPYTYQWYKNNIAVSGTTSANYTFTAQATDNNATIYAVVSDSSSPVKTIASSIAILTVNPGLSITTQPASKTVTVGSAATFTVAAAGGIPPYTYQWYKNNATVSGATSASYTFTAQYTDDYTYIRVVVSDSSSPVMTLSSSIAQLTVSAPLTITTQPASKTVTVGSPVAFSVAAVWGTTPYTYQWYKNNAAVSGATSASYTFTAQATDNNATIRVVVSDSSSPVKTLTSSNAILTVNPVLSITTQPASKTVTVGSPVAFTVAASGGITPYTYQWYKNNVAVSGATSASYTFTAQAADNNTIIRVVVSDSSSPVKMVSSNNAILTVNPALSITTQPASKTVIAGSPAEFTVAAAGGITPYTYQWYKNNVAVSGATSASYTFTAQATDNNATFHVVVSDSSSAVKTITSSIARLTVTSALSITTHPGSKTVIAGSPIAFTVAAAGGTTPYTYQWYKNNAAVSGATSNNYTFTAELADNNASIYVVVSDSSSPVKTIASSIAILTVIPAPLVIKNQPDSTTVIAGSPVEFKVKAEGGTLPYTYQWFKNNAAVSGATSNKYSFTAQLADNNASLYVVVSDSSSPVKTVASSIATLTVNAVVTPLIIINQPDSTTVSVGSLVEFKVKAEGGTLPYTYQWFKNNAAVSGATSNKYSFTAQLADNNASIYVVVSDSSSPVKTIASSIASLTVNPVVAPLTIKNQPDSTTVSAGSPVEFKVRVEGGTLPYTYQWYKNNVPVSGATSNKYSFIAQLADNNASIYVVVSDGSNPVKTVASSIAILNVQ